MARQIDLNADLGESEDAADIARDMAIMDVVSSVNIACGGHAGSERVMRILLNAAKERGIAVGAHPSYPDRENFGRIAMVMDDDDLTASLIEQLQAMQALAVEMGVVVHHVKPHGALYNEMANSEELSDLVCRAARVVFPNAVLVGLASSETQSLADDRDQPFVAEAFVDRRYTSNGRLVPRSDAGAVIENQAERVAQALSLAKFGRATAATGEDIAIAAQTLCLHSDSDGALQTARVVRLALENEGIKIAAPR
jgi:5-oxoprolinase (ATP-hydrolysing) subunit A